MPVQMRTITVPYHRSGATQYRQVIAEWHTDDLAVVPVLDLDTGFSGWWRPTHTGTGLGFLSASASLGMCLPCARHAVTVLAATGLDWGRDADALRADPAARATAERCAELAAACQHEDRHSAVEGRAA